MGKGGREWQGGERDDERGGDDREGDDSEGDDCGGGMRERTTAAAGTLGYNRLSVHQPQASQNGSRLKHTTKNLATLEVPFTV
jgi:hypothetical protein